MVLNSPGLAVEYIEPIFFWLNEPLRSDNLGANPVFSKRIGVVANKEKDI